VEGKQTQREQPARAAGTGKALASTMKQDAVEEAPRKHQKKREVRGARPARRTDEACRAAVPWPVREPLPAGRWRLGAVARTVMGGH
jgi:hypothetical protein